MADDGDTRARAAVAGLLASFLPPARAERLAAALAERDEPLEEAVAMLRSRYGAGSPALAVALDSAGVGLAVAARLVGTDVVAVNRWLDEADAAGPLPRSG